MTSLPIQFVHKELTKLSQEEAPTAKSLQLLKKELYANARSVPSPRGGGAHGHLGAVMTVAGYATLAGPPQAWADPNNPGIFVLPVLVGPGAAHTGATIAEARAIWDGEVKVYDTFTTTIGSLKKQLLEAIPREYINALEHPLHGFSEVTLAEIIDHLVNTYGVVTPEDLEENEAAISVEWNPSHPTESVFDNANLCRIFADENGEAITDAKTVRMLLRVFEKSGVLADAVTDWKKREAAQQTLVLMRTHFRNYNRRRIKDASSAGQHGFGTANAVTESHNDLQDAICTMIQEKAATGTQIPAPLLALMASNKTRGSAASTKNSDSNNACCNYCWSHGLSTNPLHTSGTCTRPAKGHQATATLENMMGSNATIKRKRGERAIYKRPERRQDHGQSDT